MNAIEKEFTGMGCLWKIQTKAIMYSWPLGDKGKLGDSHE
jgi:hypothetical protein